MKPVLFESMKRYNHLNGEINTAYHNASRRLGLSDSAMQILYTVCSFGDSCLLSDICRLTGLNKQTVNSALRQLERDDAIRLEPVNARSKQVCLTEKGKALSKRTALRIIAAENAAFSDWTAEEVACYLALTERFLHAFQQETQAF